MAKKKIETQERPKGWDRVEDFLNQLDPPRETVRQFRRAELDNGDMIDFYQFKSVIFIVELFAATGGFEVFVSAPGGRIDQAALFIKKTQELMVEMAEANLL